MSRIQCTFISIHDHFDSRFFFDFQFFYYVFALFTVRTYVAWRAKSCQKHFQKLSLDLIELWNDNKILRKSKVDNREKFQWNDQ